MEPVIETSVRDLKNNLSAYLRKVKEGHAILITSHGRPVGQLTAPPTSCAEEEALNRLLAQPLIRPGIEGQRQGARSPIQARRGGHLSEMLLDRE